MKKTKKAIRIVQLLLLIIVFFGYNYKEVKASYIQSDSSTQSNIANTSVMYQELGTGLSGTVNSIGTFLKNTAGMGGTPKIGISLVKCNGTSCRVNGENSTVYPQEIVADLNTLYTNKTFVSASTSTYTLVNTDYYAIRIECITGCPGGTNGDYWLYGTASSTSGFTYYQGIGDLFYIVNTGTTYISNITEFTDVNPKNNDNEINPVVSFDGTIHITNEDIESLESLWGIFDGFIRIQVKIGNALGSYGETGNWECQIYTEDFQPSEIGVISNTLDFDFTYTFDSPTLCPNAVYDQDFKITWNAVGSKTQFTGGIQWQTSTTTYFTVGTTNNAGDIVRYVASTTAESLSNYNSNGYSEDACNVMSLDWDITDCILSMFLPDPMYLAKQLGEEVKIVTRVFPLGYVNHFISIMSTSTIGTLTPISAELPSALGVGTPSIELDLTNSLDSILNATTGQFINVSAPDTRTFYEITSDYWEIVISILFVLYLLSRILGQSFNINYGSSTDRYDGYIQDGEIRFDNPAKRYLNKK